MVYFNSIYGMLALQRYDWEPLRENISKYGTRNSLCIAPMPTASTSQILGNNECFELSQVIFIHDEQSQENLCLLINILLKN